MVFAQGHALFIGVGTYEAHPAMNVPFTTRDAEALATVLSDSRSCGYPNTQTSLLSDSNATREAVLASLDALRTLGKDATIVLFYSGHGAMGVDGNYYLTTHDSRTQGGRVAAGSGVSEQELLQ